MATMIPLEHPGIILKEEFLDPMDLTAYRVSQGTGITESTLSKIIKGKLNISSVNGLKLARFFGLSDEYFSRIQMLYDLDKARTEQKKSLFKVLDKHKGIFDGTLGNWKKIMHEIELKHHLSLPPVACELAWWLHPEGRH